MKRLLHLCSVHKSFASSAEAKQRASYRKIFSSSFIAMQSSVSVVSREICLFSLSKSRKINFLNRKNGEKKIFSVELLINIGKVHRSCKVLMAGGYFRYKCLMQQHKSWEMFRFRLRNPFVVQELEDCIKSMAEWPSSAFPIQGSIIFPSEHFPA